MDQVFAEGLVAVQEDMVGGPGTAHRQVGGEGADAGVGQIDGAVFHALAVAHAQLAPFQVEVFQAQLFHLALAQPALPEQVEGGAGQQRQASFVGRAGLGDLAFEIVAQRPHLVVGEEFGQAGGQRVAHAHRDGQRDDEPEVPARPITWRLDRPHLQRRSDGADEAALQTVGGIPLFVGHFTNQIPIHRPIQLRHRRHRRLRADVLQGSLVRQPIRPFRAGGYRDAGRGAGAGPVCGDGE